MTCIFIGESYNQQEALYGEPFVGTAGQELYRLLARSGWPCQPLAYSYISSFTMSQRWSRFPYPMLSCFTECPKDNLVESFYGTLKGSLPLDRTLPARKFGASTHFVLEQHAESIHQLHARLEQEKPNLIVALGATACWALGLGPAVTKLRGFVHETQWGKVLPTYSPSAVLRNWSLRVPVLLDLVKAKREMAFPEIRTIEREIWTEPTIEDLWLWWETYGKHSQLLSVDIETLRRQQVSEVGFASDSNHALHIPFAWQDKGYHSWWPDTKTEAEAWRFVKHVCESPIPKIGQNLVQFDSYWLAKSMGIVTRNILLDTMQLSHCWQPELEKGLGYLGSIWLDERSWKSIRKDSQKEKDND